MARKRYLKPGFFKNEDLAELPPLVRILFTGLWCYADREGRLEDRPMRLKSDIIPYDNLNVDKALDRLQQKGFIIRYKLSDGKSELAFIQIIKFKLHQDVHKNEQESTIPAPSLHGASTVQEPYKDGSSTPLNLELNTLRTLNLEVDNDNAQARNDEIEDAIENFTKEQPFKEKEKSSAKKEKVLPTVDEAIEKVSGFNFWRLVLEKYLTELIPPECRGKPFDVLPDHIKQPLFDKRIELFIEFYDSQRGKSLQKTFATGCRQN